MPFSNPSDEQLSALLRGARRVAVVGVSNDPSKPSHEVASYLVRAGYDVVPVNPALREFLGRPCVPDLAAAAQGGPLDVVDLFRRAEQVGPHVDEAIAAGARAVWMQLGIENEEAAARAQKAGLTVVMNRCMFREHLRLIGS